MNGYKTNVNSKDPEDVFDIIQPLGEGAYGLVYKALDKRDGELVAIKIMPKEVESGSMEKELSILRSCQSPYIVNFKGAYYKDEYIWLAMEYCGAGAVLDLMRVTGQNLTEQQIQIVMKETLYGLEYLHKKKLVHRDIKAGNVLLDHTGACKLADFGVAKDTAFGDAATTIGSPYWMAPEVFGKGPYTVKADIWSLGITAIEMATGRPPHSDKGPMQVIFLIPKNEPPNLPEYEEWSEDFRDFIACCCVKDATQRPSAKALQQHKWIKGAGSKKVLQNWVRDTMPLLDEWRQQQRELEMGGTAKDKNGDQEYDDSTMITEDNNKGNKDEYQIEYEDSEEEEEEEEDGFNGGTMLMEDNGNDEFDGGTMMVANDENEYFDDSTMLFDESMTANDEKSQYAQYMKSKKAEEERKRLAQEQRQKQNYSNYGNNVHQKQVQQQQNNGYHSNNSSQRSLHQQPNNNNQNVHAKKSSNFKIVPKKQKAKKSFNQFKNKPLPSPSRPLPKNTKKVNRVFNAPKNYNSNNASNGNVKPQQKKVNGRAIESLFKDNNLLKINFAIPKNANKESLQKLRAKINDLYDADVVALETFYDDQLRILDERLEQM